MATLSRTVRIRKYRTNNYPLKSTNILQATPHYCMSKSQHQNHTNNRLTSQLSSICDIQEKFRTKIYEFPKLSAPFTPPPTQLPSLTCAQGLNHQQTSPRSKHPQLPNLHKHTITRKAWGNRLRALPPPPRPQHQSRCRQDALLNDNPRTER